MARPQSPIAGGRSELDGACGHGLGAQGGAEVAGGRHAGEGQTVSEGRGFPELEMAPVGLGVFQDRRPVDPVLVAGPGFRFDEFVISVPVRRGFLGCGRSEDDAAPLAGDQRLEHRFGGSGKEEIGYQYTQGAEPEREACHGWGGVRWCRAVLLDGEGGGQIGRPPVAGDRLLGDRCDVFSVDGKVPERGAASAGAVGGEAEQFRGARGLGGKRPHGGGGIKHDVDERPHFFAVELHRVVAGAGVRLPVDLARVIAGEVGAVVLEIEGRSDSETGEFAG